ncbi:hypothetical protein [Cereibacter changlensis]|uniref:hypothetical protein n=1 Tax=Cereibacter changlensis TaxID=402884 RepID=UPI00200B34B1|nr:hypothetical protein [Cereibacter changlensis]
MSFQHSFVGQTDGITPTVPARWRALDGVTSVFWEAQGGRGAQGYYLSDQPRILVFFNDVSSIRLTNDDGGLARGGRPLPRVLYVPAGLPMWTRFTAAHSFSHLDIHLHSERLLKLLAPPSAARRRSTCSTARRRARPRRRSRPWPGSWRRRPVVPTATRCMPRRWSPGW